MTRTIGKRRCSRKPGRRSAGPVIITLALACVALFPAAASAQRSGFSGTVTDSTGGVLPGVVVEAESPALIERVRTSVTDSQGRYNIVDLRPGVYTVSFTLPGFKTVMREEIELAGGFTATVNAKLEVGGVEEAIVVTGGAPAVDLRSTAPQTTLSKEMLESVPSGGSAQYMATLMLGVSQDSISFRSPSNTFRWSDLTFRGSRESSVQYDGFDTSHRMSGDGSQLVINAGMTQEVVINRGSGGADQLSGGLATNVIPKTGGNTFSGSFSTFYAGENFVSSNLNDELRDLGVGSQDLRKTWDFNPAFGGPIQRDKLWFMGSYRNVGNKVNTGAFRDTDPLDWVYTPDQSRPPDSEQVKHQNYSLRLTWQATERNNIAVFTDINPLQWQNRGGIINGSRIRTAAEASLEGDYWPQYIAGMTWKSPLNDRLYLDGGFTVTHNNQWFSRNQNDADTGEPVSPNLDAISAQDLDTGWVFRGSQFIGNFNNTKTTRIRGAATYITGSHTLTGGGQYMFGYDQMERYRPGDYIVSLRSGTPVSLQQWGPEGRTSRADAWAFYVTDQWIVNRATLNLGLRYDYQKTSADPATLPANNIVPERSFEGIDRIHHFHDLNPRLGLSYDLFGNNRTALKFTLNRYVDNLESGQNRHPTATAVNNTTRDWNDLDGDFVPDCDLSNLQEDGECGRVSNLNFGGTNPNVTTFDPAVDGGFANRGYNWEMSGGVEHHVSQGLGVHAGYYRRSWGNQTATDNRAVTPDDYDPLCVITPSDPRLPGGGGQEMCGFYDLDPAKLGQVDNFVTHANNFGNERRIYRGIEAGVTARMGSRLQLNGGAITESIVTDSCYTVDSPQQVFCKVSRPFTTTYKLLGSYSLPWDFQVSGAYQGIPGPALNGDAVFGRADIIGLGRPLSRSTVTLTIVEPDQEYAGYVHKLDLRVSRMFRTQFGRLTGSLDFFNITNSVGVLSVNDRFGPSWQNPTAIQGGRVVRVSGRYDF